MTVKRRKPRHPNRRYRHMDRRPSKLQRKRNRRASGTFLLLTDRYDIIKSWSHVAAQLNQRIMKRDTEDDDFCIYLEGWPQTMRKLQTHQILRHVSYYRDVSADCFHAVTCTHTVIHWQTKQNGRLAHVSRYHYIYSKLMGLQIAGHRFTPKSPAKLMYMIFIREIRVYIGLDQDTNLLLMATKKKKVAILQKVTAAFNGNCLAFIKETRHVVVGGTGFVMYFHMGQGNETSAKLEPGKVIKTSLGETEFVRGMVVEAAVSKLFVLAEHAVLIIDYLTMTEIKRFSDAEGGIITSCAMYGDGEYFVTGSGTGVIKIWNPVLLSEIYTNRGHLKRVTTLVTSVTQQLLFSASEDGWVYIWGMDVFRKPLHKVMVGDTVLQLGLTMDRGRLGFWCDVRTEIVLYEYDMFYSTYTIMDSTVYRLQRLLGYRVHPNRIMVATEDGGIRHLNPMTGTLVGYMFPMTSLRLIQKFSYDAFRKHTYMVMDEGSLMVLNCKKSPFRSQNLYRPSTPDDVVSCVTTALVCVEDGYAEDVIVLVGFSSGQIQLMVSTVFTMRRPVQAHNAAVVYMAKMLDVDEEREEVFANIRAMASVGEDGLIKMWRLRFDQARGDLCIDITMQLVMQIRSDIVPKILCFTENRFALVYQKTNVLHMYELNPAVLESQENLRYSSPRLLTHTPDYDHTKPITALCQCVLLRIFATSSLDHTVKIWDDDNELLRELIFLGPIVDCCFASEYGHLLVAFGKAIQLCLPDKYLPWSYLEDMAEKTYQNEEHREIAMPYQVSIKSWIDPSSMNKKSFPHRDRKDWQGSRMRRNSVDMDSWEQSWYTSHTRIGKASYVPTKIHKGRSGPKQLSSQLLPMKEVSGRAQASRTISFEEPSLGAGIVPRSTSASRQASDRVTSSASSSSSFCSTSSSPAMDLQPSVLVTGASTAETTSPVQPDATSGSRVKQQFGSRMPRRVPGAAVPGGSWTSSSVDRESTSSDVDECGEDFISNLSAASVAMLEGLGLISTVPQKYNVLRRMLSHSDTSSHPHKEEKGRKKSSSKVKLVSEAHAAGRRKNKTVCEYLQECGKDSKSPILQSLNEAMNDVQNSMGMDQSTRVFLLELGREIRRHVIENPNTEMAELDNLVDRVVREKFEDLFGIHEPESPPPETPAPPPVQPKATAEGEGKEKPAVKCIADTRPSAKLKAEERKFKERLKKFDKALEEKTDEKATKSKKGKEKGKKKGKKKRSGSKKDKKSAKDKEAEAKPAVTEPPDPLEILKNVDWNTLFTPEMLKIVWKVRRQPWFPSDVPPDPASACTTWVSMIVPTTEPDVLGHVIRFTNKMLETGDIPELLKEALVEAVRRLTSSVPVDVLLSILPNVSNILSTRKIQRILAGLYAHHDEEVRDKAQLIAKQLGLAADTSHQVAESARLYSEEEERLASKVRKQSWFSARKDCDVTSTFSAWMDLLTPATPCKVLREVLRFTETVLEAGEVPNSVRRQIVKAIRRLVSGLSEDVLKTIFPCLPNVLGAAEMKRIHDSLYTKSPTRKSTVSAEAAAASTTTTESKPSEVESGGTGPEGVPTTESGSREIPTTKESEREGVPTTPDSEPGKRPTTTESEQEKDRMIPFLQMDQQAVASTLQKGVPTSAQKQEGTLASPVPGQDGIFITMPELEGIPPTETPEQGEISRSTLPGLSRTKTSGVEKILATASGQKEVPLITPEREETRRTSVPRDTSSKATGALRVAAGTVDYGSSESGRALVVRGVQFVLSSQNTGSSVSVSREQEAQQTSLGPRSCLLCGREITRLINVASQRGDALAPIRRLISIEEQSCTERSVARPSLTVRTSETKQPVPGLSCHAVLLGQKLGDYKQMPDNVSRIIGEVETAQSRDSVEDHSIDDYSIDKLTVAVSEAKGSSTADAEMTPQKPAGADDEASGVHAEPEHRVQATPEHRVQAEPEHRVHAEPEHRVQAEPEHRIQAEPEHRVQAESEHRVQAEPEYRVQAEPEHLTEIETMDERLRQCDRRKLFKLTPTSIALINEVTSRREDDSRDKPRLDDSTTVEMSHSTARLSQSSLELLSECFSSTALSDTEDSAQSMRGPHNLPTNVSDTSLAQELRTRRSSGSLDSPALTVSGRTQQPQVSGPGSTEHLPSSNAADSSAERKELAESRKPQKSFLKASLTSGSASDYTEFAPVTSADSVQPRTPRSSRRDIFGETGARRGSLKAQLRANAEPWPGFRKADMLDSSSKLNLKDLGMSGLHRLRSRDRIEGYVHPGTPASSRCDILGEAGAHRGSLKAQLRAKAEPWLEFRQADMLDSISSLKLKDLEPSDLRRLRSRGEIESATMLPPLTSKTPAESQPAGKRCSVRILSEVYGAGGPRAAHEGRRGLDPQVAGGRGAAAGPVGYRDSHPPVRLWSTQMSGSGQEHRGAGVGEAHPAYTPVTPSHSQEDNVDLRPPYTLMSRRARPPPDFDLCLWLQQLERDAEEEMRRIMMLDPDDRRSEVPHGTSRRQDNIKLLLACQRLWSCRWAPGEAGIRVARGASFRHRKRQASLRNPSGPIKAFEGRMGMVTVGQHYGKSAYGNLTMLWTTRVPSIPVRSVERRARELEEKSVHHRVSVSRVPLGFSRGPPCRNHPPLFPSGLILSSAPEKGRTVRHLPPLAPRALVTLPAILQHSSFRLLPASAQDDVINRMYSPEPPR